MAAFQSSLQAKWCTKCGAQLHEPGFFCAVCGASCSQHQQFLPPPPPQYAQPAYSNQTVYMTQQPPQQSLPATNPHHLVAHGFAQTFGLHPGMALLTVVVNAMLFGGAGLAAIISLPTAGASLIALTIASCICGGILGFITYEAQMKWYDDDEHSARIKAWIVAFLTAIPVGLPGFLVIPSGIVGLFRRKS